MFEQTFKNIDDVLHKDAGCSSELDYTEQTSRMLFLNYLDDLEKERAMEAELKGKAYEYIIDKKYRWSAWAAPKDADENFDHNNALTGDDLIEFVNGKLFPYFQKFKETAESSDEIEYKIAEIFSEIKNRIQSGYSLRDALEQVDQLRFQSQEERHELSSLYEDKIKRMGNAGRNGGEYYTRGRVFSVIETARANGHNPQKYLSVLLTELPQVSTVEDVEALLPWNISPDSVAQRYATYPAPDC